MMSATRAISSRIDFLIRLRVNVRFSPSSRWLADHALERPGKRSFGIVTDVERDHGHVAIRFPQQPRAKLNAPTGEILNRRLTDVLYEALMQR